MSDDTLVQVKAVVGDPVQAPAVHDLLYRAVSDLVTSVKEGDFSTSADWSNDELARRTAALESLSASVVRAAAWGGFYGHPATRMLWPSLVGRAANTMERSGHDVWQALNSYPAVLLFYGAGIGSLAGDRYDLLAPLLLVPSVLERAVLRPAAIRLYSSTPFLSDAASRLPDLGRKPTPASDRAFAALLPLFVDDLILGEPEFADLFDRFEFLLTLVHFDLARGDKDQAWPPIGRFIWRHEEDHRVMNDVRAEIVEMGERWPPLRQGLFRGSADRLAKTLNGFDEYGQRRW